jgi:hypothetical protein
MLATCPAHYILLDLIVLTVPGAEYKSWSFTLRYNSCEGGKQSVSSDLYRRTMQHGNWAQKFRDYSKATNVFMEAANKEKANQIPYEDERGHTTPC